MKTILHTDTMEAVLNTFKVNNLVLVDTHAANFTHERYYKKRQQLLRQKWISAVAVAEYGLLDTKPSTNTVKNMIKDGRIGPTETYITSKGTIKVLAEAIHRLNKI